MITDLLEVVLCGFSKQVLSLWIRFCTGDGIRGIVASVWLDFFRDCFIDIIADLCAIASRLRLACGSVKNVMVGEGKFGVVDSAIGTCFGIGEYPGVVGAKGDSREEVVVRDLRDLAVCEISGQVLRSVMVA